MHLLFAGFGLPRVRRAGTFAPVGVRVVCTAVSSTGGNVNCPVAVRRDMLGTEAWFTIISTTPSPQC